MAGSGNGNGAKNGNGKRKPHGIEKIPPQSLAVIAALLTNALSVDSVLIARDQHIEVLLVGSIKPGGNQNISDVTIGELIELLQSARNRGG